MSKGLLITGATGQQGGAVVDALISLPANSSDFTILAVTRDANSASAQKLTSRAANIKLVQGNLNDVPSLFESAKAIHPNIWGVYSVQVPMGKGQTTATEEAQGKALVDEALKRGVKQFVYSSVERGGDKSWDNPTPVPHFISKHNIEHHLVDKAKGTDMSYAIIRPAAFMENFAPTFVGSMFAAMWKQALPDQTSLQLVSVADIGHFAAQAFLKPDQYKNRAMNLAGDELTFPQMDQLFHDATGKPAPRTYGFLASTLMWAVADVGAMFTWFKTDGYGADIPELRREHPGLLSLSDWIEKKSAFAKK